MRSSAFVFVLAALGASAVADDRGDQAAYANSIAPLLQKYCSSCHGGAKPKGGLSFAAYADAASITGARKVWERVVDNLDTEIMPPEDSAQPTAEERAQIVGFLQALLSKADCNIEQPGRVTMRRLNRNEYNNTIRDLLALDTSPADEFPHDDVGYGFDNIGDVLTLPPLLMEKYLSAAERIADRAIVVPRSFDGTIAQWDAAQMQGGDLVNDGERRLASESELTFVANFPEKGRYRLKVVTYGEQAGPEPARLAIKLDGQIVKKFDIRAVAGAPETVVCDLATNRPGPRTLAIAFINDYFNDQATDPAQRDRNLVVRSAALCGTASQPMWPLARFDWNQLEGGAVDESGKNRTLASNGEIFQTFEAPADGTYRFEVHAYGTEAGREPAKMTWRVDDRELRTVDVPQKWNSPGEFAIGVPLRRGRHRVAVAFVNDYYEPEHADPTQRGDRNLHVQDLTILGSSPAGLPESHRRIIKRTPRQPQEWAACTRENLSAFLLRAYRRPPRPEEIERLARLAVLARDQGDSYEQAMRYVLQAVLINPHFLYRVEVEKPPQQAKGAEKATRPLDDFELASRLAYFLWSSMPDDELLNLAAKKGLQADAALEAQVARMLKDSRALRLVENFAGQWLQLGNLANVSPSERRFPEFDRALLVDMKRETHEYFAHIMREDRDVRELLDSNYTFLNERLARYYGIEGVSGEEFRMVTLPAGHVRGGLLTQGSILTVTSNPTRTSPVKRGKWILEQILGTPPPPPPPEIPELKDDRESRTGASLRQRMEQHRANPSCAACHAKMDPLGFGFENFNALGAWRDKDGEFDIDSSGALPGGATFDGAAGLKKFLREQKADQFTRTLAEKLLTFGLGRGLEAYDACAIDEIAKSVAADNHRFSQLVIEIVKSDPFRKRAREEVLSQ